MLENQAHESVSWEYAGEDEEMKERRSKHRFIPGQRHRDRNNLRGEKHWRRGWSEED
jgi:hypothetical protein